MLPARNDAKWRMLVEHPEHFTYTFLALKIFMQRIARRGGPNMSAADRETSIGEAYAFFQKNERLLTVDISSIFG